MYLDMDAGTLGIGRLFIGATETPDNSIKKVIFNGPATIVFFKDGTKTVAKCSDDDAFDYEKGLAMAIVKKLYSRNEFVRVLDDAIDQDEDTDYQPSIWHLFSLKNFNLGGVRND